jgi:DNA-binding transcriptional LysR family regulator
MLDRRLSHVVATARYGSFTVAAGHVGITQSALTKSVAELERQIGYQIFERTARGVILTEKGELFVERAARLLDDAHSLLEGATAGHDPYADVLRVGVCPTSLEYLLLEPISALVLRHPRFRIEVSGASFDRVLQQLRTGSVDVALGYDAAFSEHPDIEREHLTYLQTTFFVRHGHPLLECPDVTLDDIAEFELVSPSESRPYDSFIREIYEAKRIDPRTKVHTVDYFPLTRRIVANTNAISFADISYTRTESFKRWFARVPFLEFRPPSPICCAIRRRWPPRPIVRAFIQACHDMLVSDEPERERQR